MAWDLGGVECSGGLGEGTQEGWVQLGIGRN